MSRSAPGRAARGALLVALATCTACERGGPAEPATAPVATPRPEQDDVLYALGGWLARDLSGVKFEEADLAPLTEGLADALLRRPLRVEPREVGERVQEFLGDRRAATASDEKRAGQALIAEARAQPGAQRTPGGAIYQSLVEGVGASPSLVDQVKVEYAASLRDGTLFDGTAQRGRPAVVGLRQVVPCWTEVLQWMKPGGKARVTCPSDLAYGDRGLPGRVLPGATLRYEIELLEVVPETAAVP